MLSCRNNSDEEQEEAADDGDDGDEAADKTAAGDDADGEAEAAEGAEGTAATGVSKLPVEVGREQLMLEILCEVRAGACLSFTAQSALCVVLSILGYLMNSSDMGKVATSSLALHNGRCATRLMHTSALQSHQVAFSYCWHSTVVRLLHRNLSLCTCTTYGS